MFTFLGIQYSNRKSESQSCISQSQDHLVFHAPSSRWACSRETIYCPLCIPLERAMNRTTTNTLLVAGKPFIACSSGQPIENHKLLNHTHEKLDLKL